MPSTVIKSFYYHEEARELYITFISGNKYMYREVSKAVYEAMRTSFSKGQYFNEHIKPNYPFERVD